MIKLFKATDKLYSTNGDLVLNPSKASVHKEDNGAFYLDLETPLSEKKEIFREKEAGTSVEGTTLSANNVDLTKMSSIALKGQSYQTTTKGYNLLPSYNTSTIGSLTITNNGDGSYTLNGSVSSNTYIDFFAGTFDSTTYQGYYLKEYNFENIKTLFGTTAAKPLTYRISTSSRTTIQQISATTSNGTIQIANNGTDLYLALRINGGASLSNVVIKPQLQVNNTINELEPYTYGASPNPNFPQPIESTTGLQKVEIVGKNWFDNTKISPIYSSNASITTIDTGVKITSTATGTGNYFVTIPLFDVSNNVGEKYTIKCNFTTSGSAKGRFILGLCNATGGNRQAGAYQQTSGGTLTYTIPTLSNATYLGVWFYVSTGNSVSSGDYVEYTNVELEKGSSVSDYEAYKGTTKEINLGANLLNYDLEMIKSINTGGTWNNNVYTVNGVEFTYNDDGSVTATGTASANTNFYFSRSGNYAHTTLPSGTYYFTSHEETGSNSTWKTQISINGTGYNVFGNGTSKEISKTLTEDTPIYIYIVIFSGKNPNGATFYPMISKSSGIKWYSYKTPIKVHGIGNFKNSYFKNVIGSQYYDSNIKENVWYLHKEVESKIFTGASNEDWTVTSAGIGNFVININDYKKTSDWVCYCNYYKGATNNNNPMLPAPNNCCFSTGTSNTFEIKDSSFNRDVEVFKTWLSTHNVEVVYVLNTPKNILVEDINLINQLESIKLLQGLNNISITSPYLTFTLNLKYNYMESSSFNIDYYDYLIPNNIVVANTPQGDQAFRITNVEKTRRKIKIKANHVFYDSMNYLIADSYVVDKDCNDALDHLNNATDNLSPFTTISNVTHIDSYRCVRKSLYEAVQLVVERWGGHLIRDNWTFGIYDSIGQDNGVTIRYAKNLKEITASYDWDNVVTKILPVGKDGILLNEIDPAASIYIESAQQYEIPYSKTISFDQSQVDEDNYKDEDGNLDEEAYKQALVDDLYNQGTKYITDNYLPKVNYKLSANVEKVSDVGDTIEVIDEKLGINLMTNIISYDYDCILDKYTQLEFGNFIPTLSNLMTQISVKTDEQIIANNETLQITLNEELQTATDKIWNALGNSYVIYEGDKILVVDTLPKENATNVIMINNGGIAFSNSGINGTFSSAWTIDNVLNMEQINVINLTADLIKGGTLKLGSTLNQNGQIEVYDETNLLIAELNKNGLKMYGSDGSYVLMNNTVGFAGFDANNNKIYWVDKDEFHMKKSVIEEEITLCNKMRFIPIQIYDNNTLVSDGIGLVSVIGGGE